MPQQFTYINAKLRNRMDRQIGTGTLRADARYRNDYMPDLSADPPTEDSMEPNFSSSIDEPISIDGLSSGTPQVFTFDFSENPIPAGISDLYFIVTFKGDIEGFDMPAIAPGIKDLNEPTHFGIWNFYDHYAFWGEPRTAASIFSNQEDYDRVVSTCSDSEFWLNWDGVDKLRYIGFGADRSHRHSAVCC